MRARPWTLRRKVTAAVLGIGLYLSRGQQAHEAELAVEAFLAGHRVQDDLLVPARRVDEARDHLAPQPGALMAGQDGDVADVGAVGAVRECPAGGHQPKGGARAGPVGDQKAPRNQVGSAGTG